MSALLDAALELAARGLRVFPLQPVWPPLRDDGRFICGCGRLTCTSPGKHPHPKLAPKGLHSASADPKVVSQWWNAAPNANVGLVAGEVVVVDVDPRHGGDGSLEALEGQHGALPPTWRALTGGGGAHIYFAPPEGGIPNSAGILGPGLDIRGVGGYVVAPPSLHISGRRYAWSVDHHPDETPLAPMPEWIVAALKAPAATASGTTAQCPSEWRELVSEGVAEGKRNLAIARLTGHLLRRYVDPIVTLELLQTFNAAKCSPPLSAEEVARTVASIARKERGRREAR